MSVNVHDTQTWDPSVVAKKAIKGSIALGFRQLAVQGLNLTGSILLARLLSPSEFGIYAIITFILNFLVTFGDVGLAASLVRQQEEPVEEDYRAVFTMQQIMVVIIVIIFCLISPWITSIYSLPQRDVWLFPLVALSFFLTSLQVIPQVCLERRLAFDRLAIAEVFQAIIYNSILVVMVWFGIGVLSFGIALVLRSLVGAFLLYLLNPWPIGIYWDWPRVRKHLAFGLPYQGVNFVALVNSAVNPTLITAFFGLSGAGVVAWANMLVGYLQQPLFLLNRLLFPIFSRFTQDPANLIKFANYAYFFTGLIYFGLASVLAGAAPLIVEVIYTKQWLVGLPLLYMLLFASIFVPMSIPNGPLAYALGWSRTVFIINVFKSVLFWLLNIIFVLGLNNYLAYGYAQVCTELTHLVLYFLLRKHLRGLSIFATLFPSFAAGFIAASFLLFYTRYTYNSLQALFQMCLLGGGLYLFLVPILVYFCARIGQGEPISEMWRQFNSWRHRNSL